MEFVDFDFDQFKKREQVIYITEDNKNSVYTFLHANGFGWAGGSPIYDENGKLLNDYSGIRYISCSRNGSQKIQHGGDLAHPLETGRKIALFNAEPEFSISFDEVLSLF